MKGWIAFFAFSAAASYVGYVLAVKTTYPMKRPRREYGDPAVQ